MYGPIYKTNNGPAISKLEKIRFPIMNLIRVSICQYITQLIMELFGNTMKKYLRDSENSQLTKSQSVILNQYFKRKMEFHFSLKCIQSMEDVKLKFQKTISFRIVILQIMIIQDQFILGLTHFPYNLLVFLLKTHSLRMYIPQSISLRQHHYFSIRIVYSWKKKFMIG